VPKVLKKSRIQITIVQAIRMETNVTLISNIGVGS